MHIVPENGDAAYDAEQNIGFTTPEKAARLTAIGAVVPIRYDCNDPRSFSTDSIALGYGDPYVTAIAAMKQVIASEKPS